MKLKTVRLPGLFGALAAGLILTAARPADGPYDISLFATSLVPAVQGHARLVSSASPFGVATTADGHASYDVEITISGLPAPTTLGAFGVYRAWAASPDLTQWISLGTVQNGTTTVGPVALNKFLLVIAAEPDTSSPHSGPTVLHGTSPSGWLQSFLTHPVYRGVSPW
ncbi:MAG TPA: hypothetical protein VFL95_01115 [Gemmatimonadales bacterium]|nr:hypothetical protein [Gemmatimonadales bacterium]